jgi:hypothetical protein
MDKIVNAISDGEQGRASEESSGGTWKGLRLLCGMLILQMSWTAKVKFICSLPAFEPEFCTVQRGRMPPLSKKEGRGRDLYAKKS